MNEKFEFLYSTRFWAIVLIALCGFAEAKGYIDEPTKVLIWTIAGGFCITRTIDRTVDTISTENKVEAVEPTPNRKV